MSDFFYNLVQDLVVLLKGDPHFEPGPFVELKMTSGVKCSLEMSSDPYALLISWEVGELSQSHDREQWIREALRWNYSSSMKLEDEGIFSYEVDTNQLILHHYGSLENLDAERLFEIMQRMYKKVMLWKEALIHQRVPTLEGAKEFSSSFKAPLMAFYP